MAKDTSTVSMDIGLSITLIIGRYLFNTEDLHYGYFGNGLEPNVWNLPKAQDKFSDLLVAQIPPNTKRILDVGSGSGKLAARFIKAGYKVDCVSPSAFLTESVRVNLKGAGTIHECKFEDLKTDAKYDLILFSESFHCIDLKTVMEKTPKMLNPGGVMLVCDFFKTDKPGRCAIAGGHRFSEFEALIPSTKLKVEKNLDITPETAPNMDLLGDVITNVAIPIRDLVKASLKSSHPWLAGLIGWKFKKKFSKINRKLFSGRINAKHFAEYKTYRLVVLKNA